MEKGDRGRTQRSMGASSLTIGQLAAHVGVTVRAIRHYHALGLLAEPARDASGYRRYGAQAIVGLVRIKTLAEAGVPLARIAELLAASPGDFADAVEGIDRALGSQIRELQQRRRRLAQLTQGEHLYLPEEVVAILEAERAIGVSERTVGIEREAWILVAALSPNWSRRGQLRKLASSLTLRSAASTSPATRPTTGTPAIPASMSSPRL
jgi:DNA-binding transcriptional MerR regulator